MRRGLILLKPVEILYLSPKIRLISSLLLLLVPLPVRIIIAIRRKGHLIAVLNDRLTCGKDSEFAVVSVVDSELVRVELEVTVAAVIHEYSGFSHCGSYGAVFEVFQEENFCLLQQFHF